MYFSQATAKFPGNGWFWLSYARELNDGGEPQQAADALRRVISMNSAGVYITRISMRLILLYDATGAPDSVYAVTQRAVQMPAFVKERGPAAANLVLRQGNKLVQAVAPVPGGTPMSGDTIRADLQNALKFLQLSNQIKPSVEAQYLIGAATFQIMQGAADEADKTKSCELAQLAQQSYQDAGPVLRGVISASDNAKYKQQAQDMLGYLPKFQPAIESQIKRFCRSPKVKMSLFRPAPVRVPGRVFYILAGSYAR